MRSVLRIVAEPDRMPQIHARGGLSARVTGPESVHLIGTAATPLGGDHIEVSIRVHAGARLTVRSVAATVALPGGDVVGSTACWSLVIEKGGVLDFDPEPMVVAGNAEHRATTTVRLASSATLRLRERSQIGRVGESAGFWSGALIADLDDVPMIRHRVELGAGAASDDIIDAPRAIVSELIFPDDRTAESNGTHHVRLPLAAGGTLSTWLGADLHSGVR